MYKDQKHKHQLKLLASSTRSGQMSAPGVSEQQKIESRTSSYCFSVVPALIHEWAIDSPNIRTRRWGGGMEVPEDWWWCCVSVFPNGSES